MRTDPPGRLLTQAAHGVEAVSDMRDPSKRISRCPCQARRIQRCVAVRCPVQPASDPRPVPSSVQLEGRVVGPTCLRESWSPPDSTSNVGNRSSRGRHARSGHSRASRDGGCPSMVAYSLAEIVTREGEERILATSCFQVPISHVGDRSSLWLVWNYYPKIVSKNATRERRGNCTHRQLTLIRYLNQGEGGRAPVITQGARARGPAGCARA
jgi:hypothetical protein